MNPNFAYALDTKAQILRQLDIDCEEALLGRLHTSRNIDPLTHYSILSQVQQACADSPPVYWAEHTLALAYAAASKLDGEAAISAGTAPLGQLWVPQRGRADLTLMGLAPIEEGQPVERHWPVAVQIMPARLTGEGKITTSTAGSENGILVIPWVLPEVDRFRRWTPVAIWTWVYGERLADAQQSMIDVLTIADVYTEREKTFVRIGMNILRLTLAGALLQQQRLFVQSEAPIDRAARHRHNIAKDEPSPVRVVHLRERVYERREDETNTEHEKRVVDWQYQWAVGGHWRQYVKRAGGKRIFIAPYTKGPAGKPFRHVEKLVAVVR